MSPAPRLQQFSWIVLGVTLAIMAMGFLQTTASSVAAQPSQEAVNATTEWRLSKLEADRDEMAKEMRARFDKLTDSQIYGLIGIFANLLATGGFEAARRRGSKQS